MKTDNKQTILIVDDEPHVLAVTSRMLTGCGYKIFSTNNATEALEIVENEPVDLIISDLQMPVISGIELLTIMREKYNWIPRIAITGFNDLNSITTTVNNGNIFKLIIKPFSSSDIRDAVSEAIAYSKKLIQINNELPNNEEYVISPTRINEIIKPIMKIGLINLAQAITDIKNN